MASGGAGRRRNQIAGQFAARPIFMLECAAYRVLSRSAHMVLARLEIEHAHHGGKENGRLPCTYADFRAYGVHKDQIASAIRELVALGFVRITRKGVAGNAEFRQAAHYQIMHRHAHDEPGDGEHTYLVSSSICEAEAIARQAREALDPKAVARGKTKRRPQKPGSKPTPETGVETTGRPTPETGVTASARKPGSLSISGEGYGT